MNAILRRFFKKAHPLFIFNKFLCHLLGCVSVLWTETKALVLEVGLSQGLGSEEVYSLSLS